MRFSRFPADLAVNRGAESMPCVRRRSPDQAKRDRLSRTATAAGLRHDRASSRCPILIGRAARSYRGLVGFRIFGADPAIRRLKTAQCKRAVRSKDYAGKGRKKIDNLASVIDIGLSDRPRGNHRALYIVGGCGTAFRGRRIRITFGVEPSGLLSLGKGLLSLGRGLLSLGLMRENVLNWPLAGAKSAA